MREVEIKLQVPPAARQAVDAAIAGRTPAARQHLRAAYADTPGSALAEARLALRVRHEGRRWVQTLKGAGEHSLDRFEHNVVLVAPDASATPPTVRVFDPTLHRGTPVGDRLLTLLEREGAALAVRYETDVLRRTRAQRVSGGQIELAFDVGTIHSGELAWPLCELELELLAGRPSAVLEQAQRWMQRHGLWIDTRSKAERGELLARGTRVAPSRTGRATTLARSMTQADAWRCIARECAEQIGSNASQIASGEFGDEHIHQLRVGLRRLRSAMQLLEHQGRFADAAASLFRALGVVRDRTVVEAGFAVELRRAFEAVGATELASMPARNPDALEADAKEVCELIRGAPAQALLLSLLAESLDAESSEAAPKQGTLQGTAPEETALGESEPLVDRIASRLKRWHGSAARDAKNYAQLDDPQRHRLRKRIKRLRYAIEFCGDLFDRKAVKRYLKPLRELQERLGEINDVSVAMAALSAAGVGAASAGKHRADDPGHESRRWFALGWLSARRDLLVAQAAPTLKKFSKADAFWRER